jgi:hypothetical protein
MAGKCRAIRIKTIEGVALVRNTVNVPEAHTSLDLIKRKDLEMKKVITALFVFCVFFPLSPNATYRLSEK